VFRYPVATAAVLLAFAAPAYAQTCQCIDVGDIKRRIMEAQAIIQGYSAEIQVMAEQIARTGDPLLYTQARRKKLQENMKKVLNELPSGGRISAVPVHEGENPGGTGNLCQIEIGVHPSASACIREAVLRHEQYHQQQCQKTKSLGNSIGMFVSKQDRFEANKASLVQYAMEEIGGYSAEIMFLQGELNRLSVAPECRPKPKPEARHYTAQRREHNNSPQDNAVDSLRRKFGF
jgi:hypothetical protein